MPFTQLLPIQRLSHFRYDSTDLFRINGISLALIINKLKKRQFLQVNVMDKALYVAMSAAKNNMMGQSIRANNLANVNTTGFRSDFEQARSMGVYYGDGLPTRAYALTENPATNFISGPLIETGRDLDIAVEGDGFIAVENAEGEEAYTRVGELKVDSNGILRTGNNLPVIGTGGPITIPEFQKIEIGVDGIISVVLRGAPPNAPVEVDRIKLVNPDEQTLEKRGDGLLYVDDGLAEADVNVRIISGFIEGSNVNAIEELTRILTLSRQYEMSVKMMQTTQQNSEASARLLQMNS